MAAIHFPIQGKYNRNSSLCFDDFTTGVKKIPVPPNIRVIRCGQRMIYKTHRLGTLATCAAGNKIMLELPDRKCK